MKKYIIALTSICLALSILLLSGCSAKEKENESSEPETEISALETQEETETESQENTTKKAETTTLKNKEKPTKAQKPQRPAVKPAPVVTVPATVPAPVSKKIDSYSWNPEGVYKVGSGDDKLVPGEYYVVKTSSKEASINMVNKKIARRIDGTSYLIKLNSGDEVYLIGCKIIHASKAHPTNGADGKYEQGVYKVGRDIPAGEYIVRQNPGTRMPSFGFLPSAVIEGPADYLGNYFNNFVYLTLKNGQYIKTYNCTIEKSSSAPIAQKDADGNYNHAGMYKVGKDIPAGQYAVKAISDNASYTIYKDSLHTSSSIVSTKSVKPRMPQLVTLTEGQYIYFEVAKLTPPVISGLS